MYRGEEFFEAVLVGTWFGGYLEDVKREFEIPTKKAIRRVKELIPFLHDLCKNKGYGGEKVGWPTLVKQPGLYKVLGLPEEDAFIYIEGIKVLDGSVKIDFLGTTTNEDKAMWIWHCSHDYDDEWLNEMAEMDTLPWNKKWIRFKIGGEQLPDNYGIDNAQEFLHIQRFLDCSFSEHYYPPLNWTIPQVKNLLERVI